WSGGHQVDYSLTLPVTALPGSTTARMGDVGVIPLAYSGVGSGHLWAKRAFDVFASVTSLIVLLPVLVLTAIAIWAQDRGPIFYRQRRVGRDGRTFMMWKFRSMVPGADLLIDRYAYANVAGGLLFKLEADPRVTPVGAVIRRFSIDELPQLFNVLRGDMSLVGPRPLPVDPEAFDQLARRRHDVRPGITGLWQVSGGNALGYEEMIRLDLSYIQGWSLPGDLGLLVRTIPALLVRRGPT